MEERLRKKFKDMLIEQRDTPTGLAVIMAMMSMVENDERFEHLAEMYEGIEEYKNFASEKEAKKVVEGFIAYDGSRGQHWSIDAIYEELRKAGGVLEERRHYNKWMLYIVMNNLYSDYGGVLSKLGVAPADMPKAIYLMALAKIDDRDRRESLREYFGLE